MIEVTGPPSSAPMGTLTIGDAAEASSAVALLQVVADPVRWTVLNRLAERPSCVCDLQEHVPIAASLLSYHLKVLREAGLVSSSRRGRWIDYALTDDAWDRISDALPIRADPGAP